MKTQHHIVSAVLVVIVGTIASWLALVGTWVRTDRRRHWEQLLRHPMMAD